MRVVLVLALAAASCAPSGTRDQDGVSTPEHMVLTVNAAFDHGSGSFSIVDLDSLEVVTDILSVSSDAMAACEGGGLFVVQRLGWDSILRIEAEAPFGVASEHSVGTGSNPQGIALLPGGDLVVTLLDRDHALVIDPGSGEETGRVDLSAHADGDGLPEASLVMVSGGRAFLALQRLDRSTPLWDPSGPGRVVVVDASTLSEIAAVTLTGANPSPYGRMIARGDTLLVTETGRYGVLDGGLDAVDLVAMEASGFLVTEEALGGDITDVVLVGDDIGYATVSGTDGRDRLVRFDQGSGLVEDDPLLEGDGFTLLQMQVTSDGRLLVVDRDLHEPGLVVLDAASGGLLAHVSVGMAPFSVCVP